MMRKIFCFFVFCLTTVSFAFAQTGSIEGTVTNAQTGEPVPGANVLLVEVNRGAATNAQGKYIISEVPAGTYTLRVSFVGYKTSQQEVTISSGETLVKNIQLTTGSFNLQELVVTGYGVERKINELPFAAEQVNVEEVTSGNADLLSSLSGRVSGMKVQTASGIGASSDIILRGYSSLTGNNQVLFVVDGVPYANNRFNSGAIENAQEGYDYGTTGVDINEENIASITVLKGPAAAAIYGSRASNGVIIIETKKGAPSGENVNITFNSSVGFSQMIRETFPRYQNEYGAGYAEDFLYDDLDGDDDKERMSLYTADASWGPAFDSNLMVYQWDAFYPNSPTYRQATPWVAAEHGPAYFFKTGVNIKNSLNINGSLSDSGYYTFGISQSNETGIVPNSRLKSYNFLFKGGYKINDKLQINASINFTQTNGRGRPERGYNSMFTSFRGFREVNVDMKALQTAYFRNRQNVTWNLESDRSSAFYFNNPYWDVYENYETDERKHYVGYAEFRYDLFAWLTLTGRAAFDNYSQLIEERINVGSAEIPGYVRRTENFTEYNFDLLANFNKQISKKVSIDGVVGANIRRSYALGIDASTNGGLRVPGLYALSNSVNPISYPFETDRKLGVNGFFASINLNYDNFLTVSLTGRRDKSSSLPEDENVYYYPSAAVGFTFSEFIDLSWFNFGKIRASWASVGKTAPAFSLRDTYIRQTNFGTSALYTLPGVKNSENLKPEKTKAWEVGVQLGFLSNRIFLDLTYYDQNSINQIVPIDVTPVTGYTSKFINAGNIENRGIEVLLQLRPIVTDDFSWNITANWSKNINKVKKLAPGIDFFQFASLQGGVTIGAIEGGTYGAIRGRTYVYHENGQPIVGEDGNYLVSSSTSNIIGNFLPDWRGGLGSEFRYKNFSLNFLIDVRWGGDIFSLDLYYGMGTGVYPKSVGLNKKGNPKRDPVSEGGGILQPGVNEDGTPNETYAELEWNSGYGYRANPHEAFIYDGSFVKLREVGLAYNIPQDFVTKLGLFDSATISVVGRNLWIIYKNIPYSDPEQTIAAGNLAGYQNGVMPGIRNVTFNLELNF